MKSSSALRRALLFGFIAVLLTVGLSAQTQAPPISITVVCDDQPFQKGLTAAPGFACLIQGTEKNILFDTGGKDAAILFHNLAALKLDPGIVELIVISHDDPQSLGGLLPFLKRRGPTQVFLPASAPPDLVKQIGAAKAQVIPVKDPVSVCEGVFSSGEMSGEQSLVIDTPKGLVILTGCAHSGIAAVVEKAKSVMPKEVYLVMGGFHLVDQTGAAASVGRRLRELGVKSIAPTHCTGAKAVELLKKEFGKDFVSAGAGKTIEIR
jgi:7,8-dihydropterin-6-yl-methyl-4-(beta-D-ribofuranosyl)aminobenzene 5'-phosphate synthase